jgi:hypothetical protein
MHIRPPLRESPRKDEFPAYFAWFLISHLVQNIPPLPYPILMFSLIVKLSNGAFERELNKKQILEPDMRSVGGMPLEPRA